MELYHGVPKAQHLPQPRSPRLLLLTHPLGYTSDRNHKMQQAAHAQSVTVDDSYPCPIKEEKQAC